MRHVQLYRADDIEIMVEHQIVHVVDRTVGRIFDRQNAVFAKPLLHRGEHSLEVAEIQDIRQFEEFARRHGGIRAVHPLAGDHRAFGKTFFLVCQSLFQRFFKRGIHAQPALIGAAQFEHGGKEHPRVRFVFSGHAVGHLVEHLPFARGAVYGQIVRLFYFRNPFHFVHAGSEKIRYFFVDRIDFFPDFFQIHFNNLCSIYLFPLRGADRAP